MNSVFLICHPTTISKYFIIGQVHLIVSIEKNGLESCKAEVSDSMNDIEDLIYRFSVVHDRDLNLVLPTIRNSGLRFPEFIFQCCFSLLE